MLVDFFRLVPLVIPISLLSSCGAKDAAPASPKGRRPKLVTIAKAAVREVPPPVGLRPFAQAAVGSKSASCIDAVLFALGDQAKAGRRTCRGPALSSAAAGDPATLS